MIALLLKQRLFSSKVDKTKIRMASKDCENIVIILQVLRVDIACSGSGWKIDDSIGKFVAVLVCCTSSAMSL